MPSADLSSIRLGFAAACVAVAAPTALAGSSDGVFTVIGLPDTQRYSEQFPLVYVNQTTWVVDRLADLDIRFATHYGDIVQHADRTEEWINADDAMDILDAAGVPQGVTSGNHDITANGGSGEPYIPENYLFWFGPDRYIGRPFFRESSATGMSTWQVFDGGDREFIGLSVECETPPSELAWAQGVLDRHRDKAVMFTTHRYLQDAEDYVGGVPVVPSGRYPDIWYLVEPPRQPFGIQANELFEWFIRRNPNIFLVNCGHFHEEYRQTSTNVANLPVHEVLADYQEDPNGGDGWLRIMEFNVPLGRIDVESYSPYLDQFRFTDESLFSLDVDFDQYRTLDGFAAFQNGINGYDGTRDTWINEDEPNTAYGEQDTRWSDDDTSNSIFTDRRGQSLIRFDDIFSEGDEPGRVPQGAKIRSATLVLDVAADIDNPFANPRFFVHPVLVPWEEDSTWNSLGGGLSEGADIGGVIGQFLGDNVRDGDTMRRVDITGLVQSWSNGQPNWGIAILPEIISGNDEGIEIWTSEFGNPLLRPRLEVTYELDSTPPPSPDINGDGIVNSADLGFIIAAWNQTGPNAADLNQDGIVGPADLGLLISAWGPVG